MAKDTVPIFVVGSGRNGTRMMFKLLSGVSDIEIHHEYVCTHVQPLAAEYYMRLKSHEEVKCELSRLHGSAVHYSPSGTWIDCSNKLSWMIKPLLELFPRAKFVHLTRDGRKVTGSFFHKLAPEIYDDTSVAIMRDWLQDPTLPMPPPEKKYWWNVPQAGQPFHEEFPKFNQFQRICYHWREVIRVVTESFCSVPVNQQLTIKLEDLTQDRESTKRFLDFVGVEYEEHYFEFLQRPQNVFFPMDFKLTDEEVEQFKAITGDTMARIGYDIETEMYAVKY